MDKLTHIIEMIKPRIKEAMAEAQSRQDVLTKPPGSLNHAYKPLTFTLLPR